MTRKRSLRIAVWHNLPGGGGHRALSDHIRGLLAQGHYVENWCPPTAASTSQSLSNLIQENVLPLELESSEARTFGNLASSRIMKRRLKAIDTHSQLCATQIAKGNFDLLFANSCMFFATSPIARHVNLPSVLYLQEPYRALYEKLPDSAWPALEDQPRSITSLKAELRDFFRLQSLRVQMREEIKNAAAFKKLLVNSFYSRESIHRAYGLESKVCYLGIDLQRFQPTGEPREDFVLSLGSLHYHKGPDRALAALAAMPAAKRPRFVWVGNALDQEYENQLRTSAKTHGIDFEIRILVSDSELCSLLSRAAFLLYTPRLEPFGFAPLEANACGTTVIAVAEGGIRETILDGVNGYLVEDAEPHALAVAMERLLDNPSLIQDLGQRSLAHVREHWSAEDAASRLEAELLNLIA